MPDYFPKIKKDYSHDVGSAYQIFIYNESSNRFKEKLKSEKIVPKNLITIKTIACPIVIYYIKVTKKHL